MAGLAVEVVRAGISVVVVAIGPDRLVGRAVESAISQTVPDVELIIVHDRADESAARLRMTGLGDRSATFVAAPDLTPGATRNAGVRAGNGSFFAIFDG